MMIARLAVLSALLAAPALAQPPGPPDDGPPGQAPRRPQLFISPAGEPFRSPRGEPYPVRAWFARTDTDHDGAISREEFVADALAFNARLDVDRDGFVDGFEVAYYEKNIAPEILSPLDRGDESHSAVVTDIGRKPFIGLPRAVDRRVAYGSSRNGAGLYGLINEVQPVMAQDGNLDRRIDVEEVGVAARDRFAILDKDRNGKLTLDTLPRTPFQIILEAPPPKDAGKGRRGPPNR